MEALSWFATNLALGFYNVFYAITHPMSWLNWGDPKAVMRFIYYGGSVELFFSIFAIFLVVTAIGLWKNAFMWGVVRGLEGFANTVGRLAAWAGLLMVLQQVVIVVIQRIFL
ncbi:MAG: C4-dicarboxylate ABC transporter permease, partial [Pseudomonadota bacterium]